MGSSRPVIKIYPACLPELLTRLENHRLTSTINITADISAPVWKQIHDHLVTHAIRHDHRIFGYDLSAEVTEYTDSPWMLLEGGYQVATGQKLVRSSLAGYEITLRALGKVSNKIKNPVSPTKILFFCKLYCFHIPILSINSFTRRTWKN